MFGLNSKTCSPLEKTASKPNNEGFRTINLVKKPFFGEVRKFVFSIGPLKAPRRDIFYPLFLQRHWEFISLDALDLVNSIFESCIIPLALNSTLICMIPKMMILGL